MDPVGAAELDFKFLSPDGLVVDSSYSSVSSFLFAPHIWTEITWKLSAEAGR